MKEKRRKKKIAKPHWNHDDYWLPLPKVRLAKLQQPRDSCKGGRCPWQDPCKNRISAVTACKAPIYVKGGQYEYHQKSQWG